MVPIYTVRGSSGVLTLMAFAQLAGLKRITPAEAVKVLRAGEIIIANDHGYRFDGARMLFHPVGGTTWGESPWAIEEVAGWTCAIFVEDLGESTFWDHVLDDPEY